ncbi:MAG: hypothetical protein AAF658_03135 [Myxococcota bacterium]
MRFRNSYHRPGLSALVTSRSSEDGLDRWLDALLPLVEQVVVVATYPCPVPIHAKLRWCETDINAWPESWRDTECLRVGSRLAEHDWTIHLRPHEGMHAKDLAALRQTLEIAGPHPIALTLENGTQEVRVWRSGWAGPCIGR